MDRRYQVFVSSTYTDLVDERREIIQALLEMECLPAGMEMFPAADEDAWTLIQSVIDDSDYYVVVVGGRYGSVNATGISYTEMEYDYAVAQKKPVFGFVHDNPGKIIADKVDLDPDSRAKLDAFREKVQLKHVKYYNSPEDLGSKVSRALNIAKTKNPREGWVRGQHAMTPETQAEIANLRAQVSELKLKLEEVAPAKTAMPPELSSGSDAYRLFINLVWEHETEKNRGTTQPKKYRSTIELDVTWDSMLYDLGAKLINESNEAELREAFDNFAYAQLLENPKKLPDGFSKATSLTAFDECYYDFIVQFFALGLTTHGTKKRSTTDKNKYWTLTPLGQDLLMKLRAIRKGDD